MKIRLAIALLVLLVPAPGLAAEGEMRWGLHVTVPAKWLDPGETESFSTPNRRITSRTPSRCART